MIINFSEKEENLINSTSDKYGFSVENYIKYMSLKGIANINYSVNVAILANKMEQSLNNLKPNTTFIISSLFEPIEWRELPRKVKYILSNRLSKHIREKNEIYKYTGKRAHDKTKIYIKM